MNAARRLMRGARGSVLVLSLFMSLFLVGALYYVVGIGDAILYRQAMQDAADSGAQAAAVTAAKGMNLHALMNVVMAITAGILLVLRSVEVLLEIVLGILYGLTASIVFSAKAAALIATLTPVEHSVERIGDGVEELVTVAHDALDVAHDVVQRAFPIVAQAAAVDAIMDDAHDSVVLGGFVVPLLGPTLPGKAVVGLPVEEGDLGLVCDRVADGLGRRLDNVSASVPKWFRRFLGGIVGRTLALGKRRTCADEVTEPPRVALSQRDDGTTVWLGQEEFQYRAYDFGSDPHEGRLQKGELGVRMAQGGGSRGRDASHRAHLLGRIGLAQSEYYFDGSEEKEHWLWSQRWRARLRRFRISRDLLSNQLAGACRGAKRAGFSGLCDLLESITSDAVSAH